MGDSNKAPKFAAAFDSDSRTVMVYVKKNGKMAFARARETMESDKGEEYEFRDIFVDKKPVIADMTKPVSGCAFTDKAGNHQIRVYYVDDKRQIHELNREEPHGSTWGKDTWTVGSLDKERIYMHPESTLCANVELASKQLRIFYQDDHNYPLTTVAFVELESTRWTQRQISSELH